MHFSGDVSLGTLLTICTLVGMAIGIARRFTQFEMMNADDRKALAEHTVDDNERFSRMELRLDRTHRLLGRLAASARDPARPAATFHTRDTDFLGPQQED